MVCSYLGMVGLLIVNPELEEAQIYQLWGMPIKMASSGSADEPDVIIKALP